MKSLLIVSILIGVLAAYSMVNLKASKIQRYSEHLINFFIFQLSKADSNEEREKLFKDCGEQEKATNEDVQAIRAQKIPADGKCLLACVYEKQGSVSQLALVSNIHSKRNLHGLFSFR